jgi:hypothetical protein
MNKFLPLLALCAITFSAKAQQTAAPIPTDQAYGKIDQADLEMKACDFEKDANSEILINKGELYYDQSFNVVMDCHKRIKIFNDNGKDEANIRIPFHSFNRDEYITGIQAETINLADGKQEITKLDKKQIFTQVIDKYTSAIVFSMPNVKPGSIIEYKYSWNSTQVVTIPAWYFQSTKAPVRYSEFYTHIPEYFYFSRQTHTLFPFAINETKSESATIGSGSDAVSYSIEAKKLALVNIPSLSDETYMRSSYDNLESISFHLTSFRPPYGFVHNISDTWAKVGGELADDEDFGKQLKRKLTGEEAIITSAKALKTDDAKIAYLFNTVKNTMKWNGMDEWYTLDGTSEAWNKKTGTATEINLILYHLLKKSGIEALPMVVSTRDNGRVNITYTSLAQFNRAVVYIPVDSTKRYILDASGKYNMYNETPFELLNAYGLYLNMDKKSYDLLFVDKTDPVRQAVYIDAEIKPDGKIAGTAQLSSFSYNRINRLDKYKTDGEKKYIDYLRDDNNNLKISSIKMENMDVDTLPLVQDVNFNLDLTGTDDNYIYFNPNLFTSLHSNPFLSENRHTDIDFGCLDNLAISGVYKIPAGFKIDALPKSISMTMPDHSITFRRIVGEQDGSIAVRYTISYQKSIYFKENYPDFHEFFKRMYEMLNEQIVLKKG